MRERCRPVAVLLNTAVMGTIVVGMAAGVEDTTQPRMSVCYSKERLAPGTCQRTTPRPRGPTRLRRLFSTPKKLHNLDLHRFVGNGKRRSENVLVV